MGNVTDNGLVVEPWMELTSGVRFRLGDINIETILLGDIAHALSLQCRYGGHVRRFYSVAEHCYLIANTIWHSPHIFPGFGLEDMSVADRAEVALAGLMHDAGECYLADVPRPAKAHLPEYKPLEHKLDAAIAERFELRYPWPDVVKEADNRILCDERECLFAPSGNRWAIDTEEIQPLGVTISGVQPTAARANFLALYAVLDAARTALG